ncbi:glycosyltransferase family 39 protein [Candidatus Woesearchaeota archaeon]|nr:glycosyltransferase family 39 protein [Candidatus Woesearchaeota archaeon]
MKSRYIVAILLFLMFTQGFFIASVKSRTIDEINFHLNAGYKYLTTSKWEIGIINPPLTSTLAALPLLFVTDKSKFNNFDRGTQLDYITGKITPFPRGILLASRLVPLIFMAILAYLVFLWARDLYGIRAGLFALFLAAFSPNILAFGSLVTADIGGALFIFLSMYTFWKYVNKPTKKGLLIAGLCFGLAQITKLLSVFLIPTFVLYSILVYFFKDFKADFFFKIKKPSLKKSFDIVFSLLIIFLIGWLVINLMYFFNGTFAPLSKYDKEEFMSSSFNALYKNKLVNWVPILLPKQYVLGHDQAQWQAKDEVRGFFFLGKIGEKPSSYYIFHILIKTPIPIFIFLILGFLYFRRISISESYLLIYMLIILFMLSFFSKTAVGYRHVLSIYPLKNKIFIGIISLLAVWYLAGSLLVIPHHLAYFNEFIGGPKNGYKYTIDSNLDWEQDLDLVKYYISKVNEPVAVDPGCQPALGKILVPANSLQFQKWVCYQWLKQNFEPVGNIGYSWLVYDVQGTWDKTENGYIFTRKK